MLGLSPSPADLFWLALNIRIRTQRIFIVWGIMSAVAVDFRGYPLSAAFSMCSVAKSFCNPTGANLRAVLGRLVLAGVVAGVFLAGVFFVQRANGKES